MGLFPACLTLGLRILLNTALQAAEPWCPGKEAPPLLLALFSFVLNQNQSLVPPRLFCSCCSFLKIYLQSLEKKKIVGSRELSTVQFSVVSGESVCFHFMYLLLSCLCMMGKICVPRGLDRGQRATLWRQSSPSASVRLLGIDLGSPGG